MITLDVMDLIVKLARKGYLPTRLWKLYKAVKGDFGTNGDGTSRKCLRMGERERKQGKGSNGK